MNYTRRILTLSGIAWGLSALTDAAIAAGRKNHHNGQQLLGNKIKTNGKHAIHKKGGHTVSVEVKDGKVAGVDVKHAKRGDVEVKKYKTAKKMARTDGLQYASYLLAQAQDMGTVYIGYAYIDEYGDEEIYWFPYEMIYDGDTGAIEYVPVY